MLNATEKQNVQGEAIFYVRSTDYFTLEQTEKKDNLWDQTFFSRSLQALFWALHFVFHGIIKDLQKQKYYRFHKWNS